MKRIREQLTRFAVAGAIASMALMPVMANAQDHHRPPTKSESDHRQKTKNDWRNLGYAGAALAGLGLLSKNGTLATVGVAGGLYSAYRYEQDRKSQSKMDRQRAAFYSRNSIVHDGHRYQRKTVWKDGHKYYRFVKVH